MKNDIGTDTLANGGGTFDAGTLRAVKPTSGYAVGRAVGTAAYAAPDVEDITLTAVRVAKAYSAAYVGTWVNGSVVHVDPVAIVARKRDAVRLGRRLGQLAIWSFRTGQEVTL